MQNEAKIFFRSVSCLDDSFHPCSSSYDSIFRFHYRRRRFYDTARFRCRTVCQHLCPFNMALANCNGNMPCRGISGSIYPFKNGKAQAGNYAYDSNASHVDELSPENICMDDFARKQRTYKSSSRNDWSRAS